MMLKRALFLFLGFGIVRVSASQADSYWQQEVAYTIDCQLFPKGDSLTGTETLVYTNHSPDTLTYVYFHLYLNAFQPGSYMDLRSREAGNFSLRDLPKRDWGEERIDSLAIEGERWTKSELDNTILKVDLPKPLLSGEKIAFFFKFVDKIPRNGSRMGKQGRHYDIGQWFPRLAAYDKRGWHDDQYLGSEFYADYGTFDVSITVPKEYVLAHTGKLTNEEELFPGGLPKAEGDSVVIDILKLYKEQHPSEKQIAFDSTNPDTSASPSIRQRPTRGGKRAEPRHPEMQNPNGDSSPLDTAGKKNEPKTWTWKCHADTVFDFAFAADPDFIWDRAQWEGIVMNALYQKDKQEFWQKWGAIYTREIIKFYSQTFGMWPYPQFSSVEGSVGGGIEYPQMTIITRRSGSKYSHGLFAILAHEIGHNWFYGLLGNNETRQAFLDEGFTSFATCLAMEHYYGRYDNNYTWEKWYQKKFYPNGDERKDTFFSYLRFAKTGTEDVIDTHSDRFLPGSYTNAVYPKTASILFMLQYVLGDSVFAKAMHDYYDRWHYKHPHKEDFYASIEKSSGCHLEWFFQEWFERVYTCDYSLEGVKSELKDPNRPAPYDAEVKIKRRGRAIMPLDVQLTLADGQKVSRDIPFDLWMKGPTLQTITIPVSSPVKRAVLNPDLRVQDVNRLNDYHPRAPVTFQFQPPQFLFPGYSPDPPLDAYQIRYQPKLWYNQEDVARLGFGGFGSYLGVDHRLNTDLWVGVRHAQVDFNVNYTSPFYLFDNRTTWSAGGSFLEGRQGASLSLSRTYGRSGFFGFGGFTAAPPRRVSLSWNYSRLDNPDYLSRTQSWSSGRVSTWKFSWNAVFNRWKFDSRIALELTSAALRTQHDFGKAALEIESDWHTPDKFPLWSRLYFGYAEGDVPLQDLFYVASASPDEQFGSRWYSSRGSLPEGLKRTGNLYLPGGGNLRGFLKKNAGYKRIASANVRLGFENPLTKLLTKIHQGSEILWRDLTSIETHAFFDFGQGWNSGNIPDLGDFFSDLGLSLSYRFPYQSIRRLVGDNYIRVYFPLWISDPLPGESRWKFRWVLAYAAKF